MLCARRRAVTSASKMVVPDEVMDAAEAGNLTAVREWLESGGDANDTDSSGSSTLLISVAEQASVSPTLRQTWRVCSYHTAQTSIVLRRRTLLPPHIVVPFTQRRAIAGPSSRSFSMPAPM